MSHKSLYALRRMLNWYEVAPIFDHDMFSADLETVKHIFKARTLSLIRQYETRWPRPHLTKKRFEQMAEIADLLRAYRRVLEGRKPSRGVAVSCQVEVQPGHGPFDNRGN